MYAKQNIPFPWEEFKHLRLWVTFESYEDFEDFITFLAKSHNHFWSKQKNKGLKDLWNRLSSLYHLFAISANSFKPCVLIDRVITVPYGRYFYTYHEMLVAKILYQSGYDHFDKMEEDDNQSKGNHVWGRLIKDKPYAHEEVIFPIDVINGAFKNNAPAIIDFHHALVNYLAERDNLINAKKPIPIVDVEEKRWLKNFASLFGNAKFISVTKHNDNNGHSYLSIAYDENGERRGMMLPSFHTKQMYKGMIPNKVYGFDELMQEKG